jgi:hypothetical protein
VRDNNSDKTSTEAGESQHYTSTWNAISRIMAEEGIQGLYAGMNGSLVGVASTNFAYFYWYTVARTLYTKSAGPSAAAPSTAIELSLGAAAGALAQLFTIPVAVVTTRQQTASKADRKGLIATAQEVIEGPDGVSGLWRGLKASLVLVVNPAITYGAYERLKTIFFPGKTKLKPWEAFRKLHCLQPYCLTVKLPLTIFPSPGRHVQSSSHDSHAAPYCCQSRLAVETASRTKRKALWQLRRGDAVHHPA